MDNSNTSQKAALQKFGQALNSYDLAGGHGFEAACRMVAERAARLEAPIEWSESEEHFCGDKVLCTSRATGCFHDTGAFDVRLIDIFSFRGDRICSKDTYWKIITT